jgi:hypothetical protein
MPKNNQGSTLVMLILVFAVMSIIGIALMNASVNENRHAILEHDYQQAYSIARAGAVATADYFYHHVMSSDDLSDYIADPDGDYNDKAETPFGGGSFKVSLFNTDGKPTQKIIRSEGSYNGINKTVEIAIIQLSAFNSAITARSSIEIKNPSNVNILGDIAIAVNSAEYAAYLGMDSEDQEDFILDRVKKSFGPPIKNLTVDALENVLTDTSVTPNIVYEYHVIAYDFPHVGYKEDGTTEDSDGPLLYDDIVSETLLKALNEEEIDENDISQRLEDDAGDPILDGEGDEITIDYAEKNYGSLTLNSSDILTINLHNDGIIDGNDGSEPDGKIEESEDDSLKLYFESLNMGGATLDVKGEGAVTVFVKNMEYKGDLICGANAQVLFKVIDGGNVDLQTGNSTSNLYFYGPYADFSITASYAINGSIIGDNVNFQANGGVTFDEDTGEFSPSLDIDRSNYEILSIKEY